MGWWGRLFGSLSNPPRDSQPQWTSQRGDEWWCDDATAGYHIDAFTIGSFGSYTQPARAILLISDARRIFPHAILYVYLDDETRPVVDSLVQRSLIDTTEVEVSPKTRFARIDKIN